MHRYCILINRIVFNISLSKRSWLVCPLKHSSVTTLYMILFSLLISTALHSAPIVQTELSTQVKSEFGGFGTSTSMSENTLIIGAPGLSSEAGEACIFEKLADSWVLTSCFSANATTDLELKQFGSSVSTSGDYAVISALDSSSGKKGVVYIYERKAGSWVQVEALMKPGTPANNNFGAAVSISGDHVAIGSQGLGAGKEGAVYIFKKVDSSWELDTKIVSDGGKRSDKFGSAVMLSGEYLIIGDYRYGHSHEGAAYIYHRDEGLWTLQASLRGGAMTRSGHYGQSVSISSSFAVVAADMEGDVNNKKNKKMGAAYIYQREGKLWSHHTKLVASDRSTGDQFGSSVSIHNDVISVGAKTDDKSMGSTYLFELKNGSWFETDKLQLADGQTMDYFGYASSIFGSELLVSANNKDTAQNESGAAYVYSLNPDIDSSDDSEQAETVQSLDLSGSADTDGDGLSNSDEINILYTDPNLADSDGDGLTDKEEVLTYQTDPNVSDTDSDGLSDFSEAVFFGSDPNIVDTDSDGFSDGYEVETLNTDPALLDSDSDGLTDQQELTETYTSPILADTDGDGLSDNEELNIFDTNPTLLDTDDDGISDGNEVNFYDTDPLDTSEAPVIASTSTSYSPAQGEDGTMAFEDEWPLKGDYDFNDAVFNYNVVESRVDGLVKSFVYKILPTARGAIYDNSMRLLINTPVSNIEFSTIKSKGVTTPLLAIADGNKTLFVIIENIKDGLPPPKGGRMSNTLTGSKKVSGTPYTLTVEFKSPLNASVLGGAPYNSFIARQLDNGELLEVHFPGRFPSTKASKRKFGEFDDDSAPGQDRFYQTSDNLPWAMLVPSIWHHTKERVDLSNAYPDILDWASSRGKKNKNWYKSKRKGDFVFEDVPDI